MKRTKVILFALFALCFAASTNVRAQTSNIVKKDLSQAEIDRIVKSFTDKEAEFRGALTNYVFNRNANIQTLGMGGQVTGVFRRDSFMSILPDGTRFEKILYAPMPTTDAVRPEDIEDLGGVNAYALEPSAVAQYNFAYVGKERIDELNLYVFDVTPKVIPDPEKSKLRLFTGRVWVDDGDLQIVKTKGKAVPETKINKFPVVETWRENVDGKYWFPSYATANEELIFGNGSTLKIKMRVKYTDYRQGTSEVKILGEEEEVPASEPTPKPKPTPTPTPPIKKP